jgi:hypothetical protein
MQLYRGFHDPLAGLFDVPSPSVELVFTWHGTFQ